MNRANNRFLIWKWLIDNACIRQTYRLRLSPVAFVLLMKELACANPSWQ